MAHILKKTLQVTTYPLFYQQTRQVGKINLKRPRAPHFKKALIEQYITPVYPKPNLDKPLIDLCKVKHAVKKEVRLGPYEVIIAREVLDWFKNSQMIAFLHRNSITADKTYDFQVKLKKHNMYYKTYSSAVAKDVLMKLNHTEAYPLVQSPYGLVFSSEINVPALQKILKSTPQFVLIAGILQNELLDVHAFVKYGSMNLTEVQAGLVSTLQTAGGMHLTRQLTQHQTTLIDRLTAIQQRGAESTDESADK